MNEFLYSVITAVLFSVGIHLIIRYRTFSNLVGFVCVLASFPLTYFSWKEYHSFPVEPTSMSLAEAVSKLPSESLWVFIKDINWDCSHLYHISISNIVETNIFFSNQSNEYLGIATFNKELSCNEISSMPVSGTLDYLSINRKSFFEKNSIVFPNRKDVLSYCTYCGKNNSRLGVLAGIFLLGCGMLLIVVDAVGQLIKRKRYLKETAQQSVLDNRQHMQRDR